MTDLNSFLRSARKLLQDESLNVIRSESWGSQNADHRQLIRKTLQDIKSLSPELETSVSHTQGMGLIASSSYAIGADVEVTARVLNRIVARVSSAQELTATPSPASLWCAKEACFKALKNFKPPSVLSQISIGDWQKIDSQTETCRLMNPQDFNSSSENKGIVFHTHQHTYCFFVFLT